MVNTYVNANLCLFICSKNMAAANEKKLAEGKEFLREAEKWLVFSLVE